MIALIKFFGRVDSSSGGTPSAVSGVSVSGMSSLQTTIAAGIASTEADNKWPAI
jgi:hypothetical protein